ncbi:MAG: hypothetical protein HGA36_02350 [Candidatus Moranbacteria bacterium]|nr:hypothetical protein [Candidatus Moranbacteria bacterium]
MIKMEYFIKKIVDILSKKGLEDKEISNIMLTSNETLINEIADVIFDFMNRGKKIIYNVQVDYSKNVEEMVEITMHEWANEDITSEHFLNIRGKSAEVSVELIHFNRSILSDDALLEMSAMGYRAANMQEFLAFGAKYPDLQRKFPIVGLGSVWHSEDSHLVAYMSWGASGRYLHLWHLDLVWGDGCRFAAVKE